MNLNYNACAINAGCRKSELAEYDRQRLFTMATGRILVINVEKIITELNGMVKRVVSSIEAHRPSERTARRLGLGTLYLIGAVILLLQLRSII